MEVTEEAPLTKKQQRLLRALIFGAPILMFTVFVAYVVFDAKMGDNSAIVLGLIGFIFATAFYGGLLADRKFGLTKELREKMSMPVAISVGMGVANVLVKVFGQPSRILSSAIVGLLLTSMTPIFVMTLFLLRNGKKETPQNDS